MTATAQERHRQKVKAGKARAKQFTREYQQMARAHLPHEAVVRGAKAGYAATFKTGNLAKMQARISERNKQNASSHHRLVKARLQEWGIPFTECQFPFPDSMHEVDFMLSDGRVIEVDGFRFKAAPFGNADRDYQAEFQAKRARLERAGYLLFVFDARDTEQEFGRLKTWLGNVSPRTKTYAELPF